jgi:hypothetical protein
MEAYSSPWDHFISSNKETIFIAKAGVIKHPTIPPCLSETTAHVHDYTWHKTEFESRAIEELGINITRVMHEHRDQLIIPKLTSKWLKPEEIRDPTLKDMPVRIFRVRCDFYTIGVEGSV